MTILRSTKLMKSVVFGMGIVCIGAAVAVAQQSSQVLGKTNLQGWIDEAPGLPNSVEEASARRNAGSFYQPFYDKVEAFKKSYKQSIANREKPDAAQAGNNLARFNSLPVIQQMGGIEKLAQMTPEQRANLAKQMMQSMQQNPVPRGDAASTAGIQSGLQSMIQERSVVETAFSTRDAEITNYKGSHREINEDAVAKLAAIPMVNDPVMGRVHDLDQQAALNKQTAARHHDRANWELQQRNALIAEKKARLKDLAAAYQNWLNANFDKINASTAPTDLLRGANTEIGVAEYELSFIDAAYDLAKYSEAMNKDAAGYNATYQEGNGAIRKRK